MPILNNIEASIVSLPSTVLFHEYAGNGQTKRVWPNDKKAVIIESNTDERFGLGITLKKGFRCFKADGIKIEYQIDGMSRLKYSSLPKEDVINDRLSEDRRIWIKDFFFFEDGEWCQSEMSFGTVFVEVESKMEMPQVHEHYKKVGNIRVDIQRVTRVPLVQPEEWEEDRFKLREHIEKGVHWHVLKEGLSHFFKPTEARKTSPPASRVDAWPALQGKHGKPTSFVFYYRSYPILQSLRLIPTEIELEIKVKCIETERELRSELEKKTKENEALLRVAQDQSGVMQTLRSLVEQLRKQAGLNTAAASGTTSTTPSDITTVLMLPLPPAVASASDTCPREGEGQDTEMGGAS